MLVSDLGSHACRKQAKPLPKTGEGAVCQQYKRCGKPGCRCARGELHGPYYALFWRNRGRLRKRYLRSTEAVVVEAECQARREHERNARAILQLWKQEWREVRGLLHELEREGAWG